MSIWRKYITIISANFCMVLLLASCNDSKVSQCQRLIATVNDGNSLLDINKGTQVITSLKLAQDLEAVSQKIQEQSFEDSTLTEYQSRFVKIFTTISQNINKAGKALGATKTAEVSTSGRQQIQNARDDIDNALKAAEAAGKQSDILAGEVNRYCSQIE